MPDICSSLNPEAKMPNESAPAKGARTYKRLDDATQISRDIVDRYDVFLLDMDGVLWTGQRPCEGAAEAVKYLKGKNKKVFYVTNNSSRSRKGYVDVLARKGFPDTPVNEIYCTAYAIMKYLKVNNFSGKCCAIGNPAMWEEAEAVGLKLDNVADRLKSREVYPQEMGEEKIETDVDAVIMGFDPAYNYYKLACATVILDERPDVPLLVTNTDLSFPVEGRKLPGTGCLVKSLEIASGRTPQIIGKPGPFIIEDIMRDWNVNRDRICMVGDNLLTDIAFGNANGIASILVETGVHQTGDIGKPQFVATPDFVIPGLASLNTSA
eukprot:Selendium_serpulae@DN3401_c0_g1_i1.p1